MRLPELETHAGRQLGLPVTLVQSDVPVDESALSLTERGKLKGFSYNKRRSDWLLGRNALKSLLSELGEDTDTGTLTFPSSRVSLTHANDIAVAVGTLRNCNGIGVDYEVIREVEPRVARWFLTLSETSWLLRKPEAERSDELIRLWTIKEAAYKSHPRNKHLVMKDFVIKNIQSMAPTVRVEKTASDINVSSLKHASGYLSIAILKSKDND